MVRSLSCVSDAVALPEIQVVHGALGVTHIDVEGEQIDWSFGPATQHLPEVG